MVAKEKGWPWLRDVGVEARDPKSLMKEEILLEVNAIRVKWARRACPANHSHTSYASQSFDYYYSHNHGRSHI
jgi:hypothetical protein